MNRAVLAMQDFMHHEVYDPLTEMLGVTDWVLRLRRSEETDELRIEQIKAQKNANARTMQDMGFTVEMDGDGEWIFSQEPVEEPVSREGESETGQPRTPLGDAGKQKTGEPRPSKPSEDGGMAQGHPASGKGTSPSMR